MKQNWLPTLVNKPSNIDQSNGVPAIAQLVWGERDCTESSKETMIFTTTRLETCPPYTHFDGDLCCLCPLWVGNMLSLH